MVRLYEYQGKKILKNVGVPVPEGRVVETPEGAEKAAKEISGPVVIKAQVWSTGRMKAGGIKFADSPSEAKKAATELLNKVIKDHEVERIIVERRLDISKEFYCGVIVDDSYKVKGPKIIVSSRGGVDIEKIAEKSPEKIAQTPIAYIAGLQTDQIHDLLKQIGLEEKLIDQFTKIAKGLYVAFKQSDARSAEINPLVLTEDGDLYAADCRIAMDDASAFRHDEFQFDVPRDMPRRPTELEKVAWGIEKSDYRGVAYFTQINPKPPEDKKNGYLAFHSIGGGGAMIAADVLTEHDFVLANYIDTSGNPTASKVYRVARVALSQPEIEGYAVFAPTMANQDQWHHAHGFVKAIREELKDMENFPVLILICGNKEKESQEIIKKGLEDLPIQLEVYGREHHGKLDYLADRMKEMVVNYRG